MKSLFTCLLFFICSVTNLPAQSIMVSGKVTDEQNAPVPFASIGLIHLTGRHVVTQAQSDSTGMFSLSATPGKYLLKITCIGYRELLKELSLTPSPVSIGQQVLTASSTKLGEIRVAGRKPVLQQSGGKLIVNLSQSAATPGVSVLDMLKRLPGISADQNGQLLMRGSSGINVIIDGKPTYLSKDQLANMLSGMPADNIARVEIMPTSTSDMDANGNAGTISITTKKQKSAGYAFDVASGIGKSNKNTFFTNNIGGNYNTGRMNIYGSLDISSKHRYSLNEASSYTSYDNEKLRYDRASDRPVKTVFYTYKLGTDWNISKKSALEFSFDGYLDNWKLNSESNAVLSDMNGPRYRSQSFIQAEEPYYYNTLHSRYSYLADSSGKSISVDADYIRYSNNSDGEVSTRFTDIIHEDLLNSTRFKFSQPIYIDIFSARMDAALPLKPVTLKTGLKFTTARVNNPIRYWNYTGAVFEPDDTQTGSFRYNEQLLSAYVSGQKKWQHTSLDLGLRLEHTVAGQNSRELDSAWNYASLFPTLSLTRQLGSKHQLELSVARRINRPSYTDLNPTKWFYDANYYTSGTPGLKPAFSWNTMLTYTLLGKYVLQLGYSRTREVILKELVQQADGLIISRDNNFPYSKRWDLGLILPVSVCGSWEITGLLNGAYNELPLPVSGGASRINKRFSGNAILNQQFTLPWEVTMELSARYSTGEPEGYMRSFESFSFDGGISKKFLAKRFTATLTFTDLFFSDRMKSVAVTDLIHYHLKNTRDSRRVFLLLKYHFGGALKKTAEHYSDEKGRL
ncbi:outer membrane beta-barrel protein [Chitinophaga sp. OAE865]|uniref:outer membrane beta-barrel protein n=1 Tax=Chitinophaga sp. OAE865 TaxID=2817898 RepID=UPI001AE86911